MPPNGPAIWGGCVTRRSIRAESWYFSQKTVTVQGGYGTCFCRPGTKLAEHYECRGTSLIVAANLSPVTKLVAGTSAVSRYKLSRRQKFITVQIFKCEQMSVSGCKNHYEFVLGAGVKAKTVTNNLPILSVLADRVLNSNSPLDHLQQWHNDNYLSILLLWVESFFLILHESFQISQVL